MSRRRGWSAVWMVLCAVPAVVPASPANAATTGSGSQHAKAQFATTFVGRVRGSNAYVAILKDGAKIGGYVCNDGPGGGWMKYTWLHHGSADLRSATGKVGRVSIAGSTARGTVQVSGRELPFTATKTRSPRAGLYFATGLQPENLLVGGWILLPDGTQRGAVSSVSTRSLRPSPTIRAPRLNLSDESMKLPGPGTAPPPVVEPQPLVVINIIAVLIGLLLPAVQK